MGNNGKTALERKWEKDAKENESKETVESNEAKPETTSEDESRESPSPENPEEFGSIKIGDKEVKIVNKVKVLEIWAFKLETGKEFTNVIAHDFMMVDHKKYMVEQLTQAINVVMSATKRRPMIAPVTEAMLKKMYNKRPRIKDLFKRRKK